MRVKLFIFLVLQLCFVATWAKPHPMDAEVQTNGNKEILSETATVATGSEWESYEGSEEGEGKVSIFSVVFIQFY